MRKRAFRVVNNRLTLQGHATLTIMLQAIFLLFYINQFAVPDNKAWQLAVFVLIFTAGGFGLLYKTERNWLSIVACTAFPILLFEASSYWPIADARHVLIVDTICVCISVPLLLWEKVINLDTSRYVKIKIFAAKTARLILAILCLVCVLASFIGFKLTNAQTKMNHILGYENPRVAFEAALEENMPSISRLDPNGGYITLSNDEKEEALEDLLRVDAIYLGMYSIPNLVISPLEEGVRGQYERSADTIIISSDFVDENKTDGYELGYVLLHELYHRYSYELVELLEEIEADPDTEEKYAKLLLLNDAKRYRLELANYVDPDSSFFGYRRQALELDANAYAKDGIQDYQNYIEAYLYLEYLEDEEEAGDI